MPFDPGRGGGNNYNYSNSYVPQSTATSKKSKKTIVVLSAIGVLILVLGVVAGTYILTMKKSQVNINNSNGNNADNKSDYVEVEIFDVGATE